MTRAWIAALLLPLAACGGEADSVAEEEPGAETPSAATPSEEAPEEPAEKPESDRCEKAAAIGKAIATGAQDGTGLEYVDAAAVKSEDFDEVYFVAMRFSATGVDDQTGVWATNSLKPGGGLIMSVDGFAKEFTVWPDGGETDAQLSTADDGAEEAVACLS